MRKTFINDEAGYLSWVKNNSDGYVVNLDKPLSMPEYPMVHRASHKAIASPMRTNYTTGRYIKVCSNAIDELETWSSKEHGRELTRCSICM